MVWEVDASQCVRAQVVIAVRPGVHLAITGRVAGRVLRLLVVAMVAVVAVVLLSAATTAKHLIEEAKLRRHGGGQAREGEEDHGEGAHYELLAEKYKQKEN